MKLVSVIIPTFHGSSNIKRAIDSVINQTYKPIEIIVVDDNEPTDSERLKTKSVINQYYQGAIKYIEHEHNMNGSAARNTGIKAASGDYISFLDDDDAYLSTKIERCVALLNENPEHSCVLGGVVRVLSKKIEGLHFTNESNDMERDMLIDKSLLGTGSNLFLKKSCVVSLCGFDESFVRNQDVEFMARFFSKYKALCVDEVLTIKILDRLGNIPSYSSMMLTKQFLFKKFGETISKFSIKDRERFFAIHYYDLLSSAVFENNKELIVQALKEVKKYYKGLDSKCYIKMILSSLFIGNNNLMFLLKRYYRNKGGYLLFIKQIKTKKFLTNSQIQQIKQIVL